MRTFFYLDTCKTCQRIKQELPLGDDIVLRDIKATPLGEADVDQLQALAGSYEALFSRRAMKFRQWGLHEQTLAESDYRRYLLEDYTFLKRPVLVLDEQIFIGNSKKQVQAAKAALES